MTKHCVTFVVCITSIIIANHIEASDDFPTYGHVVEDIIASREREHELIKFDEAIEQTWSRYRKLVEDSRKPTRTDYTRGNYAGIDVSFTHVVPNSVNSMSKKRDKLIADGTVEIFRSGRRPKVTRTIHSINTTTKPYTYELIDTITLSKGDLGKHFSKNTADLFFGSSPFVDRSKMRSLQRRSQNWNSNSIPGPISMINSDDSDLYRANQTGDLVFKKTTIVDSFQEGLDCPTLSFAKDLPFHKANVRQMKAGSSLSILDKSRFHEGIGAPLLMWSLPTPIDPTQKMEKGLTEVSVLRFLKGNERDTISLDLATFTTKMNGARIDAAFGSCGSSPLYFLNHKELEHAAGFKIPFDLSDERIERAYLPLVQNSNKRELMTLLESIDGPILQNNTP